MYFIYPKISFSCHLVVRVDMGIQCDMVTLIVVLIDIFIILELLSDANCLVEQNYC